MQIKSQPTPAILGQESVHTTLSITHHTKERPSTGPQSFNDGQEFIAKEMRKIKRRASISKDKCEENGIKQTLHDGTSLQDYSLCSIEAYTLLTVR
jgi:hypothetical protein